MKTQLLFPITLLFYFSFQAQVEFQDHIITNDLNSVDNASSVYAADIDGDGDLDVVFASLYDYKLGWFENLYGLAHFGPQRIIATDVARPTIVHAIDIDNDGDLDVASCASYFNHELVWYENLDGQGNFGPQHSTSTTQSPKSVITADIDGDGDQDFVAPLFNEIIWKENTDGLGQYGNNITIVDGMFGVKTVYPADFDSDGDIDILSATYQPGSARMDWLENLDGQGNFSTPHLISTSLIDVNSVHAADIDGDGDLDAVSASEGDNKIAWYENTDGLGTFGLQQIVTTNAMGASWIVANDIDMDGDLDLLSTSLNDNKIAWYENADGQGNFGNQQNITTVAYAASSVYAADLDADGDMDVLSASLHDSKVAWYENPNGQGTYGPQKILTTSAKDPRKICVTDIDGNGNLDVLCGSHGDNKISWYKNLDGQGNFGGQQIIALTADRINSVSAVDLDTDGDMDVISASILDNKIAWHENLDGQGTFSSEKIISTEVDFASDIQAADFDADGDLDVVYAASAFNKKLAWRQNSDGQGNFGSEQIISTTVGEISTIDTSDIDGDGKIDIVTGASGSNDIAWYKNFDGNGTFIMNIISTNTDYPTSVHTSDIDGDGDMDVVATYGGAFVAWYENLDGLGNFSEERIITDEAPFANDVYSSDIDEDGDIDVISTAYFSGTGWYENLDGLGTFGSSQLISSMDSPQSLHIGDINNDGHIDIVGSSDSMDEIIWFENKGPLGIAENKTNHFSLYPNPTSGLLNIQSKTSIAEITIFNNLGQLLLTSKNKYQMDISTLSEGIYFVKIKDENGQTESKKVMKI